MSKQKRRALILALLYLTLCILQVFAFCNSIGFVYRIDPFSIESVRILKSDASHAAEPVELDFLTSACVFHLLFSTPVIPSEDQSYSISRHIPSDGQISIYFDESRENLRYKQIHILFYTDEQSIRKAFFAYEYTEHEKLRAYIANKTLTPKNPDPLFLDLPLNTAFTPDFFSFFAP